MAYEDRQRGREGKGRPKENRLSIELDIDSVAFLGVNEEGEGKFEIMATATTKRGGRRVQESVKFCVGGSETQPTQTDSDDGSLTATIPHETKATSILVKALTTGDFKVAAKRYIALPWPKAEPKKTPVQKKLEEIQAKTALVNAQKQLEQAGQELKKLSTSKPPDILPPPDTLFVSFTGERGKQKLVISVAAAGGILIPGFTGIVQNGNNVAQFKTGTDGVAIYKTNFSEASRLFQVRAGNTPNLIWRGRLLGPKP